MNITNNDDAKPRKQPSPEALEAAIGVGFSISAIQALFTTPPHGDPVNGLQNFRDWLNSRAGKQDDQTLVSPGWPVNTNG